ncbi:pyruvate dehydrogenase (acetyl-transferring) E1 component subunit alpha [Streptomyces sp. NPDC056347]|uniref:pyruvate dehydrogenase (acetyl-transferring) E1 component subunit alpha n=1 Tax=unclassified Streptomyces TaxID=2593676 RepID=UPI0035E01B96
MTTGTVQLLTHEGELVPHPDYRVEISAQELRDLYHDMAWSRRMDAEGVTLQRQGELGLWPSLLGQEAAQIGAGHALEAQDYVFPSYRDHGIALCRDVDPLHLLRMFRGVSNGGWDPAEKNFHLYTLVIGSQALHATGYAMGLAKDGAPGAVLTCFGDGATSQGDVSEAFNFAAVYDAPVVFFCQNNQWAISESNEKQTRVPLHQRAQGFGFPGVRVDGNDVLACRAVTEWALERARSGEGPTLIEAYTYRMGAHTTSDDPTKYRDPEELEHWRRRDPIARLRTLLEREGWADEDFFTRVDATCEERAVRLRARLRETADPSPERIFDNVYADGHPLVAEERAEFAAYRASFITSDSGIAADGEAA